VSCKEDLSIESVKRTEKTTTLKNHASIGQTDDWWNRRKDGQAGRQTDSSPLIRELQVTLRKKKTSACNGYLCLSFSLLSLVSGWVGDV